MREALDAIVLMLAPVTPHLSEVLWQELGHDSDITFAAWPQVDASALVASSILVVVQVNGKVRGKINVPADAEQDAVIAAAVGDENVQRFIADKTIRKQIYVPGKLVNIVAN